MTPITPAPLTRIGKPPPASMEWAWFFDIDGTLVEIASLPSGIIVHDELLRAIARLERPFLHAERLAFTHPRTGDRMTFAAPLPDDLRVIVADIDPSLLAALDGVEPVNDDDTDA